MKIEDTNGELRADAELLFQVAGRLDRGTPELSGGWYKLSHDHGSGYAWVRLIGDRARRYPPQSLHVVVFPHLEFREDPRLSTGKDWWGKEDRHLVVPAGKPELLAVAVEVIARAFWIDSGRAGLD